MKGTHVLHWIRCATDKKVPCPREYSRADVHRRHCQYGDLDPAVSSVWDTEFPPISEAMVSIFLSLSLSHSLTLSRENDCSRVLARYGGTPGFYGSRSRIESFFLLLLLLSRGGRGFVSVR